MRFTVNKYEKLKLIILLLVAASLPFYLKVANVLIGIGAFLTVLNVITTRRWDIFKPDKLFIGFLCYFLLDLIGLLYTEKENLANGFFTLDKHQALIFIPLIFADCNISPAARKSVLLTFVASCTLGAVICIAINMHESITVYDRVFHEWLFSHDRVSAPIGMQAVYFALYASFCSLILLNLLKDEYHTLSALKKTGLAFLFLFLLAVIVALGARTVTVALILIIFFNIVRLAREQRSYKLLFVAGLVPLAFAGFILLNPIVKVRFMDMIKTSYENSNYGSYFARTHIWVPGLDAIGENILFGVGTGDHQTELNKKYVEYNYSEGIRNEFNMHNQYLQTLLNFGLVGLLVLFSIFYIQVKEGLLKKDVLYLSFLTLFMIACVTESTLVINKGILFFLFFSFVFFKSKN